MNELIKELWEQSAGQYIEGNQHTYSHYTIDNPNQFAELIVWSVVECLEKEINRLLEYQATIPPENAEWHYDVDLCVFKCQDNIESIKKHFGIE